MASGPTYVTLAEAASLLGVTRATLRNWDKAGKLNAVRHPINGYRLYDLAALKNLQQQLGLFQAELSASAHSAPLDIRSIRILVSKLHNILRDSDSQSNILHRFDELSKLLFAKVITDTRADDASPLSANAAAPTPADVRRYYRDLASQYSDKIPKQFSELHCSDKAISECAATLRLVDFKATRLDIKGVAYEEVLRNTFDKGDHQQFFTPPHIVETIISMIEPYVRGTVCDPASGTGGFLASIARRALPYESITGIEIDARLSWITAISLIIHDAHNVQTVLLPNGGTLGSDVRAYFKAFDLIVTNPPFGSDYSDADALDSMVLGKGRSARRRGILFIERCHDLLKDNGILAIIIDEGVLNLSHAIDVRQYILSHFDIMAVVSLPETAFMPYATVNSSILIMRKASSSNGNSKVFFARAEAVGRKASGDDDIRYDRDGRGTLNSDLPDIARIWRQFLAGAEPDDNSHYYVANVKENLGDDPGDTRIDFQFHHPSRWAAKQMLTECHLPLAPLSDLCSERNTMLVPSQELADTVIPYTGLAHIEPYTGVASQIPTVANSLKSAVRAYEKGDILFAKMRPNLRKVAFMDFDEPGYASPECTVLTVNRNNDGEPVIDPLLLSILLRSDFVFGQIMHLIAGIGRPRISIKDLRQIMLPVPSPAEQAKIREGYIVAKNKAEETEAKAIDLHMKAQRLSSESVTKVVHAFSKAGI